jgi:hypothetical protein
VVFPGCAGADLADPEVLSVGASVGWVGGVAEGVALAVVVPDQGYTAERSECIGVGIGLRRG